MKTLRIAFSIETLEDFHLGTGLDCIGLYDDGQVKDLQGMPFIPSETLKGLLKQSCAEVKKVNAFYNEIYEEIFSFRNLSSLDLLIKYDENSSDNPFIIHTFTKIDENTGKGESGSLRDIEFGSKGCIFNVDLFFDIKNTDKETDIKTFLELGIQNLKWIGGSRRRGFGKVKCSINDFEPHNPIKHNPSNPMRILLELKDDVCIGGGGYKGNHIQTLYHINATTILGMFRNVLMKAQSSGDMSFLDDGKFKLTNFYPINSEEIEDLRVIPAPLSLRKIKPVNKYMSFKQERISEDIPHWAIDIDPKEGCKRSFDNFVNQDLLITDSKKDSDGASDKSISNEYIIFKGSLNNYENAKFYKPKTNLLMRNRIEESSQKTQDDGVFTQEALLSGNKFVGEIWFNNNEDMKRFAEVFKAFLTGERFFHLGKGAKPVSVIKTTIGKPKHKISEFSYHKKYITLTLESDIILYDEHLMPKLKIYPEDLGLQDYLLLKNDISSTSINQSFTGLAGMRRFTDISIEKGSCFLYEFKEGKSFNDINNTLEELQNKGLGFKKSEGFGRIIFNLPIHEYQKPDRKSKDNYHFKKETSLLPHYQKRNLKKSRRIICRSRKIIKSRRQK